MAPIWGPLSTCSCDAIVIVKKSFHQCPGQGAMCGWNNCIDYCIISNICFRSNPLVCIPATPLYEMSIPFPPLWACCHLSRKKKPCKFESEPHSNKSVGVKFWWWTDVGFFSIGKKLYTGSCLYRGNISLPVAMALCLWSDQKCMNALWVWHCE